MYEGTFPHKRYKETLEFLREHIPAPATILDLGVHNPFVDFMEKEGYTVTNTSGEDLDLQTDAVKLSNDEVVTAFEIFEHLIAPFNVLRDIKTTKLVTSVPLKLWFSPAYKSKTDPWDRHYHEFEDWQFDWLLEKAGWKIKATKKWTHPINKIGFRPLLRYFTPRYYIVYAERK
ncbi:methyltransferase [Aquimarina sp. MMG015]|uniref:methyltransferase n=1 Tax=unclassified Aquimarina TaxID=2627091 RepID=UPI000E4E14FF|nr:MULTISPECIES: methyltransferase [unclassified Aquimarina]AXT56497.1 methyltransferase [Aquimarina sp. AD1]MBQ4803388.1 methyltransferase [Aquimarina sp. MMG015]RKN06355.1 methyltransferase [Aquimarina sp. AD1]